MPILGLKTPGPSKPSHFSLEPLIRPNILALHPYRCARDDYDSGILLDANENALGPSLPPTKLANGHAPNGDATSTEELMDFLSKDEMSTLNRYPSPTHDDLKKSIATFRGVPNEDWVFLGVGSDECIDLLFRVLCVPGKDKVMTTPPTYGMYQVTANINDIGVVQVPLITKGGAFQLDEPAMEAAFETNPDIKMLFICSPGNPTGTLIPLTAIRRILDNPSFKGVVVVDEAYIDFAVEDSSAATLVNEYANVCVTQTLSKSFGLAAIRLGYILGSPPLIQILMNAKSPYNVSLPTASIATRALSTPGLLAMSRSVATLNQNRVALVKQLESIPRVGKILGGNHANFVLAQICDTNGKPSNEVALEVYQTMAESRGVVVRFRGKEVGCEGCLRITVGTQKECATAVEQLRDLLSAE